MYKKKQTQIFFHAGTWISFQIAFLTSTQIGLLIFFQTGTLTWNKCVDLVSGKETQYLNIQTSFHAGTSRSFITGFLMIFHSGVRSSFNFQIINYQFGIWNLTNLIFYLPNGKFEFLPYGDRHLFPFRFPEFFFLDFPNLLPVFFPRQLFLPFTMWRFWMMMFFVMVMLLCGRIIISRTSFSTSVIWIGSG